MSFISFKAALVFILCVPLIPISIIAIMKIAKRILKDYWKSYSDLGGTFLENLQGLTTLKVFNIDEKRHEKMNEEAEKFRKITMKVLSMQLNSITIMDLVAFGGAAAGTIVALIQFKNGEIPVGSLLIIILLSSEFFIPLRLLGSYFHIAMNGMAASKKIFKILDLDEGEEKTEVIDENNLAISFKNVGFAYDEERSILNGVDLDISEKGFVSIVGESGCGKSTITNIIMGRNKGYSGNIHIGEKELSNIKEESIMKNITLVTHNPNIFKGTVEENLRMGKKDATKEQMEEALRKVNLLEFMNEQDGINTKLLEQGSNLSGGQKQRLNLARAILHDTPVYIFDEATSNIDAESENEIMAVINKLAETKTVILISHRLQNVVKSDCIYAMKDGKVAEAGTHNELINNNGEYASLYNRQKQLEQYGKGGAVNE